MGPPTALPANDMDRQNPTAIYLGLIGLGLGLLVGGGLGTALGRYVVPRDAGGLSSPGKPEKPARYTPEELKKAVLGKTLAQVVALLGAPGVGPQQDRDTGRLVYGWPSCTYDPKTNTPDRFGPSIYFKNDVAVLVE